MVGMGLPVVVAVARFEVVEVVKSAAVARVAVVLVACLAWVWGFVRWLLGFAVAR